MPSFPTLDPDRRAALLAQPSGPVDVVIDTDPTNEIDDQFALIWALLHPERLRVKALYACPYGHDAQRLIGGALLSELGSRRRAKARDQGRLSDEEVRGVTPAEGAQRALAELQRVADLAGFPRELVVAGADRYLPAPDQPAGSPAVEHLIALSREPRDGPLYVLAIGGATNVASVLLADPTIVERIVVVWTSAYPSFWPYPNASYNLAQDLPASRLLFSSGVPLVYLPGFYVGEQLRTTQEEIAAHVAGKGPLGDYLAELYASHHLSAGPPGTSKVIWDLINVAWVLEPSWLATRLVPTPHLGEDLRWQPVEDAPLMREATDVDRDAVFGDLFAHLART